VFRVTTLFEPVLSTWPHL